MIYDKLVKVMANQDDDYTNRSLLRYTYSKKHYKIIAIGFFKQQNLDANPRTLQQISFTVNLYEW